ncbi:MAG: hypothetical protein ACXWZS_05980 [Gemmatirosa sp.]
MLATSRTARRPRAVRPRLGSALLLTLVLTVGFGTLVLSAVYLAGNATAIGRSYDREQDFKYAADAAVAIGKSQLNHDPYALPDSGYAQLVSAGRVDGADGQPVRGLTINVYAGPSGSTTGQFGRFASIVAEARDIRGARFVRRLEVTQESFARFAYWSNRETQQGGGVIYFGGGDVLWGPVWSNDEISIGDFGGGATFNDEVATASTISGKANGSFRKGYQERQDRIEFPTSRQLDRLPGYAASGGFSYNAPNNGSETAVRMRLEFVALDLSQPADGDSTDADEGFVRAYTAGASALGGGVTAAQWLRGDYTAYNCGDWHRNSVTGDFMFYPQSVHDDTSFTNRWSSSTARSNSNHRNASLANVMGVSTGQSGTSARYMESGAPAPRCFLGGDPHLAPVDRPASNWPGANSTRRIKLGGVDTTFTRVGNYGTWSAWGGTAYAPLVALSSAAGARRRATQELQTLFPLWRGANAGTKGVLYVNGTAGISGTLRGKVTIYSSANLVLLDDLRYATDPSATDAARAVGRCADVLGLLATHNVVVADNGVLTPVAATGATNGARNADDSKDLFVHAVIMAMQTSFGVEDYSTGPTDVNGCQGSDTGRGCLFLTGGVIQDRRGAVGTSSGSGFIKRYSYDRCAAVNPPPYFPTTGRFLDNRYYELDPVRFDVAALYRALTPNY